MKQKYFLALAILGIILVSGCVQQSLEKENTPSQDIVTRGEVAPEPIRDSGVIEATILDLQDPYGKIKINKVIEYRHHPRAKYAALSEGDEVNVIFQWGSKVTTVDSPPIGPSNTDINLSGVNVGDKIRVSIGDCPKEYGCGNGWTLYEYSLIN